MDKGSLVNAGVTVGFMAYFSAAMQQMLPWFAVMLILTASNLLFGCRAAKYRGEVVVFTDAVKRTLNKLYGYVCWISIAVSLDIAFSEEDCFKDYHIRYWILFVIFGIELYRTFRNWLEPYGIVLNIDWGVISKSVFGGRFSGVKVTKKEVKDDVQA